MDKAKNLPIKNFRVFLWMVIIAAVVYLIVRNITAFSNILLVVLGFGAVVLIHEFGHFIVAKLAGIKVEAFSIFMPPVLCSLQRTDRGLQLRLLPRLFAKQQDKSDQQGLTFTIGKTTKPGETEYRIGLIPFGGFVKMLGQDDLGPVKNVDDPRSYANKPVGVRMAVISAGVVFNAISAILIFMIVFLVGIEQQPPIVGGIIPGSPAAIAGLKPGDEIIEIAGKSGNLEFSDIGITAALSGRNEKVPLKVKHEDGTVEDFEITASEMQTSMGPVRVFGILAPYSLTIADVQNPQQLLEKTGLRPADRIKAVNGKDVYTYWQMEQIIQSTIGPKVTILAERIEPTSKKTSIIETQIPLIYPPSHTSDISSEFELYHICSMVPRLRIIGVADKPASIKDKFASLLRKIGIKIKDVPKTQSILQQGDIILAVGDVNNPTFSELRDTIAEYEGKQLPIKVLRIDANGIEKTLTLNVVPRRPPGGGKAVIGIAVALDTQHPVVAKTIPIQDGPPALPIPRGAVITAINKVKVSDFYDIIREIRQNRGKSITIHYQIDEKTREKIIFDTNINKDLITVKSNLAEFIPFKPLQRLYKARSPIQAIRMGYKKTAMFITMAYVTLQRIIGGLVSPKSLMGPAGIMAFSYQVVANRPLIYYVYFLGLISAFISVFNFLPMLPFDGGHIVLLLIEKIKGGPISQRVQGAIAYAGWVLVGTLLLYVTFNDIVRIIRDLFS